MRITHWLGTALLATLSLSAQATVLKLDGVANRSAGDRDQQIESLVKHFTQNVAILTKKERETRARAGYPMPLLTMPVRVDLGGVAQRPNYRGSSDISLAFDTTGDRVFPPSYEAFLQNVFNTVKSRLNLVFGLPSEGGTVWIRNYDADIGDRDAVAGGIYLDNNGSSQREIRFPVYADGLGIKAEVTAVNFVHTLLLAYMGSKSLPWDGWNEGLVRAATARICRTPGALPSGLDTVSIENILSSSYDIGPLYDWNNQRALAGPRFIAANLRDAQLPIGGSIGGLYLLRYQMSGSAWQKVLVQYPAFASSFLASYRSNTSAYNSVASLAGLAQTTIQGLGGSTVEGQSFSDWLNRQYILDPGLSPGLKLQVQPFPIVDGLAGSDFGVFAIQAHLFSTALNGDETLLQDSAYPIYWSADFTRFFGSAQDDRINIQQAYGSVVPNFPNTGTGEPYRVTVDVPVQNVLERVSLPAGAIATATNPTVSNFYGTITGIQPASNQTLTVEVQYGSTTQSAPVKNFAFGIAIADSAFDGSLPLTVRVKRTVSGVTSTVFTRNVNKGPGSLGLELDVDARTSVDLNVTGGLQFIGTPIESFASRLDALLGLTENATQAARWNPALGRFDFFPASGSLRQGYGTFLRAPGNATITVKGSQPINQPISIALQQGWNMVCNPLGRTVNKSELQFVTESEFPQTYAEATGTIVGPDIFQFVPGTVDPITTFPESGNFTSVNGLPAGGAFFIKVLSATGTTVVFGAPTPQNRAVSTTSPNQWTLRVQLTGNGVRADAVIGQRTGATTSFDRAYDTERPPGVSGLGLTIGSDYYRETRNWGGSANWTLQMDNLKLGRSYTIRLTPETSRMTRYKFRDPARRYTRDLAGEQTYTFTATGPTRTMTLETVAPR